MKALSIRQPYAEYIASKKKTLEVRTWRTHYRGPLTICSSQKPDEPEFKHWPSGKTIRKDAKAAMCPYDPDCYVWELKLIKRVRARSVKGRLGIFNL